MCRGLRCCWRALEGGDGVVLLRYFFFFQAEDGIRDYKVTGVQTCALPICTKAAASMNPAPPATKYRSGASPFWCAVVTSTAPARSAAAAAAANARYANMIGEHSMGITGLFRRLGEILVHERMTTPDIVEKALARARTTGERVGQALVALGAVKDDDVLRALAQQQSLAYLTRDELPSPLPIVKNLSPKYLRQYAVCPVSVEGNVLTVATADPLNPVIVDDLAQSTGLTVKVVVSSAAAIAEAIDRTYDGVATPLQRIVEGMEDDHGPEGDEDINHLRDMAFEAPVVRLVNLLIENAINAEASDIHIEPFEDALRFRFRIDGILFDQESPPRRLQAAVTAPTGSGKTTTLYAALDKINSPDRKIITVEDPVEYQLKGVNQIAVKPKIGLTFAIGLRHIVRQDPDVILIGEIRDLETSEIAIQASLTGHLVFSTLHTNDAPGAITRLQDMGVEPYLVASVLEGVLAQRLVPRIFATCRVSDASSPAGLTPLGLARADGARLYRGRGCDECRGTGYRGRTGIYELFPITEGARSLILRRAPNRDVPPAALEAGVVHAKGGRVGPRRGGGGK